MPADDKHIPAEAAAGESRETDSLPGEDWPLRAVIRWYAHRFVPDTADAEDIAQETWLRLYAHYPTARHGDPALARTIARNLALDWLRHGSVARRDAAASDRLDTLPEAPGSSGGDPFAVVDLRESLRAALDPDEFQVLLLSFSLEMTLAEIAGWMRRPLTTIASIRKRALGKARRALAPDADATTGKNTLPPS